MDKKIIFSTINSQNSELFDGLLSYETVCRLGCVGNYGIGIISGGVPVGAAFFSVDENTDIVIEWFYIHPDHRGCGYGTAMIDHIREIASGSGITNIWMDIPEEYCSFELDEFIDEKCIPDRTENRRLFEYTIGEMKDSEILHRLKISGSVQDFTCVTRGRINHFCEYLEADPYEFFKMKTLCDQNDFDERLSAIYLDHEENTKGIFIVQNFKNRLIVPNILKNFDREDPMIAAQLIAYSYDTARELCDGSAVVMIVCRKPETELLLNKAFPGLKCSDMYHIHLQQADIRLQPDRQ